MTYPIHPRDRRPPGQQIFFTRGFRVIDPHMISPAGSRPDDDWEPLDIDGIGGTRQEIAALEPPRPPIVVQRLTPENGLALMVAFADAAALLLPQLGSPERLAPTHQLSCRADVFATNSGAPWEQIVEAVTQQADDASPVAPLTPPLAHRLGLTHFLRTRQPVVSLAVVDDPTRDHALAPEPPVRRVTPATERSDFERTHRQAVAAGRRARRARASLVGRFRAWLSRGHTKRERRSWFRQLAKRPLTAQLWATRPTAALLLDGAARQWVRETGALAGIDGRLLVKKWELYWRRRGV